MSTALARPPAGIAPRWRPDVANDSIRAPTVAELLAARLRKQIVRGHLQPGSDLPVEAELLVRFGVGRPTLREALRVHESEGLLSVNRGARGGARVLQPSVNTAVRATGVLLQFAGATLGDVRAVRQILEPAAAEATRRADPASLDALRAAFEIERRCLSHLDGDLSDYSRSAMAFHDAVLEASGNPALVVVGHMVDGVRQRVIADASQGIANPKAAHRNHDAHRRLLALVEASQADDAEKWWCTHLEQSGQYVLRGRRHREIIDTLD